MARWLPVGVGAVLLVTLMALPTTALGASPIVQTAGATHSTTGSVPDTVRGPAGATPADSAGPSTPNDASLATTATVPLGRGNQTAGGEVDGWPGPSGGRPSPSGLAVAGARPGAAAGSASGPSPTTQYSLDLANGTLSAGQVASPQGAASEFLAYVPATGRIFASSGSDIVEEIDPGSFTVVGAFNATLPVGDVVYDPLTGQLLAESDGLVAAIDPATGSVDYTVAAPNASAGRDGVLVLDPIQDSVWTGSVYTAGVSVVSLVSGQLLAERMVRVGILTIVGGVFDPVDNEVYLTNYENNSVEVFNATTDAFVTTLDLSEFCCFTNGLGIDPASGDVFVSMGLDSPNVLEISGATHAVIGGVTVGGYASGSVYDPGTGDMYVADAEKSQITVIDPANLSIVGTAPLAQENALFAGQIYPIDVPTLGEVYVATYFGSTVDAVSTALPAETATLEQASEPYVSVVDPYCSCLVIGDAASGTVSFVNSTSFSVVATTVLYGDPYGLAIDPTTGDLWVTLGGLYASSGVEILNATTGAPIAVDYGGAWPWGITFDPVTQQMFVAEFFGTNVRVYSGANLSLVALVPVGYDPMDVAFDPEANEVFVSVWGEQNLTVLNATTYVTLSVTPLGDYPTFLAYDAPSGELILGQESGPTLLLNASSLATVAEIGVDFLFDVAPGPAPGLWLLFNRSGAVYTLNVSAANFTTTLAGIDLAGGSWLPGVGVVADDAVTGEVYLIASTAAIRLTNLTLRVNATPVALGSPVSIETDFVGGSGPFSFHYVGLPPGCVSSNVTSLDCTPSSPGAYPVTVSVTNATGISESTTTVVYVADLQNVVVEESGLPAATAWSYEIDLAAAANSTSSSVTFQLTDGTYGFAAWATGFTGTPASGAFEVDGGPVTLSESFAPMYTVSFVASGLAAGTHWEVDLGAATYATNSTTITAVVPNGTYGYSVPLVPGYVASPSGGDVTVAGGNLSVEITFRLPPYRVTFEESGLPNGTSWGGTFAPAGGTWSTTSIEANFSAGNGTYAWTVAAVAGFAPDPASGTVTVAGRPAIVAIQYYPEPGPVYPVQFEESGLPATVQWNVTVGGETDSSVGFTTLDFDLSNGSYPYSISAGPGWVAAPSGGVIVVAGVEVTISVTFSQVVYSITFRESGLPADKVWAVSVGGVTVASAGSAISFPEGNGSYNYTIVGPSGFDVRSPAASGRLQIVGSSINQSVQFAKGRTGTLRLTAAGLPKGATWCAVFGGAMGCTSRTALTFRNLTPALYQYELVSPVVGQVITAKFGGASVSTAGTLFAPGRTTTLGFHFEHPYLVVFDESGLPFGTEWSVRLGGQFHYSDTSSVTFEEPNGSYAFSVDHYAGFAVSATPSRARVRGGPAVIDVTYREVDASHSGGERLVASVVGEPLALTRALARSAPRSAAAKGP